MILDKALTSLLLKKSKDGTPIIIPMTIGVVMLPVILIVAIFSPSSSSDTPDAFIEAYNGLKCVSGQEYQLEDVRAFETYLDSDVMGKVNKKSAESKLKEIYFTISSDKEGKNCFIKSDSEILEILSMKHKLTEQERKEIIEDVQSVRNGRENILPPIANPESISLTANEIDYKVSTKTNVLAIGSGVVVDAKGKRVRIEHAFQKNIDDSGDYSFESTFSEYSLLSNIKVSVGDVVPQGAVIGSTKSTMHFALFDTNRQTLNPKKYFYVPITVGNMIPPLKKFSISDNFGKRELSGNEYHYGIDLVDQYGSDLMAVSDGTIIAAEKKCPPDEGYLGNMCPSSLKGAGNYVQEQIEYEGKKYIVSYLHMEKVKVKKGDIVSAGDVIGTQGNSGNSTGSHLHFEIHENKLNIQTVGSLLFLVDPNALINFDIAGKLPS